MGNDTASAQSNEPPTADDIVSRFKAEALSTALNLGLHQRHIEAEVMERLGGPLGLLELFIAFARDIHSDISTGGRRVNLSQSSDRFLVATRLHARACQMAAEISTLLRNGFADGANARWRSLHETACITIFITTFNDNDNLAKRYMDYHGVEVFRLAEHRWNQRDLVDTWTDSDNAWRISEEEYLAARQQVKDLTERYGNSFRRQYGWATEALGQSHITFADVEEWVELNHQRTNREIANANIHAGPRGTLWRLGSQDMGSSRYQDGRSAQGLDNIISATAISLAQASYGLYGAVVTWDWFPRWQAQWMLVDELRDMLLDLADQKAASTDAEAPD